MSMSPTGITGLMDEEAVFEAEIAQQLEHINLDANYDQNDFIEDEEVDLEIDNQVSPEISNYLQRMQEQTAKFEQELNECDALLNHSYKTDSKAVILFEESQALKQAAAEMGLDIEEYRQKILEDIEKEDELPMEEFLYDDAISLIGEKGDVELPKEDASDIVADNTIAVIEQSENLRKMLEIQIKEIEEKQKEKDAKIRKERDERQQLEEKEMQEADVRHQQRLNTIQQAEKDMNQEKMIHQKKMEKEVYQKQEEMKHLLEEQEETINYLEMQVKEEMVHYEESRKQEEIKQNENRLRAAVKIQSFLRGFSVRKVYGDTLQKARRQRYEKKQEERIAQVEIELRQRDEEKKKKEEEEKERLRIQEEEELEEKNRLEEEQRKRQEREEAEKQKKEEREAERKEKEKLKAEQKRQEEEAKKETKRKQKEEQQRIANEKKQKEEEERRKKEEQKKLEKERKEKEQKEKKKQEQERLENERMKKEEEEQKEQEKLENEKNAIEEQKKKELDKLEIERKTKEEKREQERFNNKKNTKEVEKQKEHEKLENERREQEQKKMIQYEEQKTLENERNVEQFSTQQNYIGKNAETNEKMDDCKLPDDRKLKKQKESGERIETKQNKEVKVEKQRTDLMETKMKNVSSEEKSRVIVGDLPVELEAQRLEWIKNCIPWSKISNEPWKLKPVQSKVIRCPTSAKKMQPIQEHVILTAAQASSLRQVSTVQLEDLPGCSLSTLGQCWGLQCLKAINCGLVAVEGLQSCKQLQYLDLKNNSIVYVDLKDTGSLQYVDLSHNSLSAIHGMDNCSNLRRLDLSNNRISRLGGLGTLRRLHTLILASNQLISTEGLGDVPTLQTLTLSHNHLQEIRDLDKLCLLQHLNASANNVLKIPALRNHVLLQELNFEDNSINSLQYFSSYWLPLLSHLNLAQNSLDELESLKHLFMLKDLNISNNQILDGQLVVEAVSQCKHLKNLDFDGNPASESMSPRLFEVLPRLVNNQDTIPNDQTSETKTGTNFEAMCSAQVQMCRDLVSNFEKNLESTKSMSPVQLLRLCEVYFSYCDKSFKLAVEHRYAHEYGDTVFTVPTAPTTPKPDRPLSARTKHLQNMDKFLSPKEMFEKALTSSVRETGVSTKSNDKQNCATSVSANVVGKMLKDELQEKSSRLETFAATKIQASWKGYQTRKKIMEDSQADDEVQALQQNIDFQYTQEMCDAATKIQAAWRGYILRRLFHYALDYARMEDIDDDDDLDYMDIDIDQFDFDEKLVEEDWRPPDTPQLPARYPVLGKPPSGRLFGSNSNVPGPDTEENISPPKIKKAWRSSESQASDISSMVDKRPISAATSSVTLESCRTVVSKKEERITEEWGFKDTNTAHLMLQRAKKMKYNSERRKKLSKLDPKQRLALFRKLEETTGKNIHVHPPPHKTLPRKEYFQARQNEINRQQVGQQEESHTRVTRTYEWVHTQVGAFPQTNGTNEGLTSKAFYGSEGNLPVFDKDLVNKRTGLTNSPACMELLSVESGSLHGETAAPRRYSAGEGQGTKFPPIKTSSAPSIHIKEKMSWRSKKVEASVGWGGGKKRSLRK